jgi:hypothetical protein
MRESIILGLALVGAALVFGLLFQSARSVPDTIKVVGSAETSFTADTLKWSVTLVRTVDGTSPAAGYRRIREDVSRIEDALIDTGVAGDRIRIQATTSRPVYDRNGAISGYRIQQPVQVVTEELDAVENLATEPEEFIREGMILERSSLEYFYSDIDSLKQDLLADATRDARTRAERIAQAAEVAVGAIRTARAGVFQIREPFSTEVSSYGVYNTQSREKEIAVTLHATFVVRR